MTGNQPIKISNTIRLDIKREDLIHPFISGNKYRKLTYNIAFAKANNYTSLLTFGGAYSNHIAATAAAGKEYGFDTIGIIRGDELAHDLEKTLETNPTLSYARSCGMNLQFVSRSEYRAKDNEDYLKTLRERFKNPYILPEGGTNTLAIKGCEEILGEIDKEYDYICCAVGTGGTISGIINTSGAPQKVLGFPALKEAFLHDEISKYTNAQHWELIRDYHFGGYAKVSKTLIDFMNNFYESHKIIVDPIYTGKMMFGIFDLISKGYFPQNSRILAIHTGGLQGIEGMNKKLLKRGLPTIKNS